jgi:hypothetical protein
MGASFLKQLVSGASFLKGLIWVRLGHGPEMNLVRDSSPPGLLASLEESALRRQNADQKFPEPLMKA